MLSSIESLKWEYIILMFLYSTLPETNSSHLKIGLPKRKFMFQPSIFGGLLLLVLGSENRSIFTEAGTMAGLRPHTLPGF